MGLFTKEPATFECKLCGKHVTEEWYTSEYGICTPCFAIMSTQVKSMLEFIPKWQDIANNSDTPDERITYLKCMLDLFYEYKIKYVDNDVDVIEQDVSELIDEVIDCISEARL